MAQIFSSTTCWWWLSPFLYWQRRQNCSSRALCWNNVSVEKNYCTELQYANTFHPCPKVNTLANALSHKNCHLESMAAVWDGSGSTVTLQAMVWLTHSTWGVEKKMKSKQVCQCRLTCHAFSHSFLPTSGKLLRHGRAFLSQNSVQPWCPMLWIIKRKK